MSFFGGEVPIIKRNHRESRMEAGPGFKLSLPDSRDICLPTRPHFPRFPQNSVTNRELNIQIFAYGEILRFQTITHSYHFRNTLDNENFTASETAPGRRRRCLSSLLAASLWKSKLRKRSRKDAES